MSTRGGQFLHFLCQGVDSPPCQLRHWPQVLTVFGTVPQTMKGWENHWSMWYDRGAWTMHKIRLIRFVWHETI